MRRVLIVEDSASTRAFVRAVLEATEFAGPLGGCEVVEASSGFDAMRLLPAGALRPDRHRHQHDRHQRTRAHSLHPEVGPPQRDAARRHLDAARRARRRARAWRSARTSTFPSRSPRSSFAARATALLDSRARRVPQVGRRALRATDGRRRTRRKWGTRRVLQRGAGARRRARTRPAHARRAAEEGAVRPGAHQRRLPRGAHAQGPLGALRGDPHGGALAPARGRARRSAPRPHRDDDARCSTCSSRPCRSTRGSSPRRRARPPSRCTTSSSSSWRSARSRGKRTGGSAGTVAQYDLDPGLLGVLTEYEEHRLRSNIQEGLGLYKHPRPFFAHDDRHGARRAQGERPAARRDHHVPAHGRGRRRRHDRARDPDGEPRVGRAAARRHRGPGRRHRRGPAPQHAEHRPGARGDAAPAQRGCLRSADFRGRDPR